MHIKKKDKVLVLSGVNRGKTGEVLKIFRDKGRAIVAGVNLVKKHTKASREKAGGIISVEAPLNVASLALVCPKCGRMTRSKFQFLADGTKTRVCRKCAEQIL